MSDYAKALADREERINALKKALASSLPEEIIGGFDPNGITLEIGCGHGHFLSAYASNYPNETCVGIDLISHRIDRALRKKDLANLTNLSFFKASDDEFFEALPPRVTLGKIFLLFLDPWPKKRHHKNRIIQEKTLSDWASRSRPGTCIYFRTDHEEFFEWSREVIANHPHWGIAPDMPWDFECETYFQSIIPDKPRDFVARFKP